MAKRMSARMKELRRQQRWWQRRLAWWESNPVLQRVNPDEYAKGVETCKAAIAERGEWIAEQAALEAAVAAGAR